MKIGFIGTGNMGGALASAVSKGGCEVYLYDKDAEKANALAREISANSVCAETLISECDFIFIGVKPQFLPALSAEIKPLLDKKSGEFTLVSMAAGVSLKSLNELFGSVPTIRIMPNTPASVGKGVILYCTDGVDASRENAFKEFMAPCGTVDRIEERLIDAASAVSGCGPAFAYMFIDALADGAVECGLPRDKALDYAASTLEGAAALLKASGRHPAELKDAVCSPAGSTIEGVRALEEGSFRAACINAVKASYERTKELGQK